ncbi:MAG: hypothetical protein ABIH82_00270 [Candidatus Woesearchaeota archaeon]
MKQSEKCIICSNPVNLIRLFDFQANCFGSISELCSIECLDKIINKTNFQAVSMLKKPTFFKRLFVEEKTRAFKVFENPEIRSGKIKEYNVLFKKRDSNQILGYSDLKEANKLIIKRLGKNIHSKKLK